VNKYDPNDLPWCLYSIKTARIKPNLENKYKNAHQVYRPIFSIIILIYKLPLKAVAYLGAFGDAAPSRRTPYF